MKNKGPKAAYELVRKHSDLSGKKLHDELAKDISTMAGSFVNDPAVVLCIAKSLLYERTHDGYIHDSPVELEPYLEDFASEDTIVMKGPPIMTCKGYNSKSHSFLEAEGVYTCESCQETICRSCNMSESDVDVSDSERTLIVFRMCTWISLWPDRARR